MTDLTDVSTHFRFGANWAEYSQGITQAEIDEAVKSLSRLIHPKEIEGRSFFDIGCGSGLSMLAALRLGARSVHGIDLDPDSVATARRVLGRHATQHWTVEEGSVFDLSPERQGTFDIVHSWGVLHHTGNMDRAIRTAVRLVNPGGLFVVALYSKTPLCGVWTAEKRLYTRAGASLQRVMRGIYKSLYRAGLMVTGRSPSKYIAQYRTNRGMDWHHDVVDWMGGYPYESITPARAATFLSELGFDPVRSFVRKPHAAGFFGTHCDEFVARSRAERTASKPG